MRVYVSGPMSGVEDHNFPAFNAAAAHLRTLGYDVVNPADNGADPGLPWSWYLRKDLQQLVDCDAVATLPGWTASRGACLEIHVAHALGIPVKPLHDWPTLRKPEPSCAFPDCRYDARPDEPTCELHQTVTVTTTVPCLPSLGERCGTCHRCAEPALVDDQGRRVG